MYCATHDCTAYTSTWWLNDSMIWMPFDCKYRVYNWDLVVGCLKKKEVERLIFLGDSLTRSTFHDIAALLSNVSHGIYEKVHSDLQFQFPGIVELYLSFYGSMHHTPLFLLGIPRLDSPSSILVMNTGKWNNDLPISIFTPNLKKFVNHVFDSFHGRIIWLQSEPWGFSIAGQNIWIYQQRVIVDEIIKKDWPQMEVLDVWTVDLSRLEESTDNVHFYGVVSRSKANIYLNMICNDVYGY